MSFLKRLFSLEYILFIPYFLVCTTLSFTAFISFAIYIIVYLVSCLFPNYGQFLTCNDVLLDEDFVNSIPQSTIVTSLALQRNMSLGKLRYLFTENVLKSRSKTNPRKLRYPKLKQYLTTFICFRIWKNDPCFDIKNHIVEELWNGTDLANIHQEYLNKKYEKLRSPWEMVLIRNVNFGENSEKGTSLLVLRVPHVMADGLSLQKLLVECLGNKQLKIASAQQIQESRWDNLKFIVCFPFNFFLEICGTCRLVSKSFKHPWIVQKSQAKSNVRANEMVVAISSKLKLSHLKHVAKDNKVKMAAVLMSLIAGATRKICGKNWDNEVAILYPLPKPNHPESLTNHMNGSMLRLPTDEKCELKRLQQCHQILSRVSEEKKGRYTIGAVLLFGLQIYPINRLFVDQLTPSEITNNAGEMEGFSVGDAECIDYCVSVGTLQGKTGVVFCAHSYRDGIKVAVVAKQSILSKEDTENLAHNIELELQLLLQTFKKL